MLFELSSAHFYKLVLFPTDRSTNLSDNIFFIRCLLYQIHCLFLYQCHAGTPFRFFQYCSYRNQEFLLQSILSFHNIFQSDIKKSIRAFIIPLLSLVISRYHQETKAVRIQLMGDSKGKRGCRTKQLVRSSFSVKKIQPDLEKSGCWCKI